MILGSYRTVLVRFASVPLIFSRHIVGVSVSFSSLATSCGHSALHLQAGRTRRTGIFQICQEIKQLRIVERVEGVEALVLEAAGAGACTLRRRRRRRQQGGRCRHRRVHGGRWRAAAALERCAGHRLRLGTLCCPCGGAAATATGTWSLAAQHVVKVSLVGLGVEPKFLQVRLDVLGVQLGDAVH